MNLNNIKLNKENKNNKNKQINFNKKHYLENEWTLYYDPPKGKYINFNDYENFLEEIYSFSTVEDFWRVQNVIPEFSKLSLGSCYRMFKKGIRPVWEDETNAGSWYFFVSEDPQTVDKIWEILMLCCIGKIFGEFTDNITGVFCNARNKIYKFGFWIDFAAPDDRVKTIGRVFKKKILENFNWKTETIDFQFVPFTVTKTKTQLLIDKKNKKNKKKWKKNLNVLKV
uniref:Translation initiation factor 4E n=1 Tax=Mimivirus LCMiAC02 TaxID=2506609 RepID=A0A481Z0U3_9VIRU|nr:MAG: translation initiation factor 4E [Mimivirus LCMiAC02]